MNYQILALDLDGTLTNSNKEISKHTLHALIDIQKEGKKVVLASGRPTTGILPVARQLCLEEYGGYILAYNGGCIIDCRTGTILYNKLLPDDITGPLFYIVKKYSGIDILAYKDDTIISGIGPNEYSDLEAGINHMPIRLSPDFLNEITSPGNKFLVTGNPETLCLVREEIIGYFRSYLNVYCSEPFFLEIMPPGIDKARGLLRLLSAIGLSPDQMICCGDGENDLTMIETAGLGVAMANAQPSVLESADYITKSNDDDGVLHVINTFMKGTN